jgi:hypothetical protein
MPFWNQYLGGGKPFIADTSCEKQGRGRPCAYP